MRFINVKVKEKEPRHKKYTNSKYCLLQSTLSSGSSSSLGSLVVCQLLFVVVGDLTGSSWLEEDLVVRLAVRRVERLGEED